MTQLCMEVPPSRQGMARLPVLVGSLAVPCNLPKWLTAERATTEYAQAPELSARLMDCALRMARIYISQFLHQILTHSLAGPGSPARRCAPRPYTQATQTQSTTLKVSPSDRGKLLPLQFNDDCNSHGP